MSDEISSDRTLSKTFSHGLRDFLSAFEHHSLWYEPESDQREVDEIAAEVGYEDVEIVAP